MKLAILALLLSSFHPGLCADGGAVVGKPSAQAAEPNSLARIKAMGLPMLPGKVPAYYSAGYQQHAKKLQAAVEDMNAFYTERLGVQAKVILALLDAKDWTKVTDGPYSLPGYYGPDETVFLMPATSDNPVFGLMQARKSAIPPEELQAFLKDNHTTFDALAGQFVDLVSFHELGHTLLLNFGIDPQNRWFNEFLASYFSYAYIAERQPEWKRVFALLGRPSKIRPKNTSLDDFDRLYDDVDDVGWYHGMFESRIREIYPQLGLKFLADLKREFPLVPSRAEYMKPIDTRMKPSQLLELLEKIAPGFQKWAAAFDSPVGSH